MAWCLFGPKPWSEAILAYYQLGLEEQTSLKFESKYQDFQPRKSIWVHRLQMAAMLSRSQCVECHKRVVPLFGGDPRNSRIMWISRCHSFRGGRIAHDDVIKWKHFPRYWPFVWGIHRSPMNSPHKGQWRGALMFSLICAWMNNWVNNRKAGDLRRHHAHYAVTVMCNSMQSGSVPWHVMTQWGPTKLGTLNQTHGVLVITSQWCHGVCNHRQLDCLFNIMFKLSTKGTPKLRIIGP